ncbi:hypothetical protein N431DRAFT_525010 [Stipitochalara longipes BDJ]|nr:hypothetical protein N431DRAFT_525010 [Stipitochalara longipes BDJ]
MYPKEQWLALKPAIQRLYIEEGQTFTQVAEHLDQHHGFKPTKKQFFRRVKEWGLEKNVKQDERRAILESLGYGMKEEDFEARKLRGRRLDKAKIERWKKREGLDTQTGFVRSSGKAAPLESRRASIPMELCIEEDTVEELCSDELLLGSMALDHRQTFNPWLSVDTINSPHLTGLIGALTLVELCDDIPDLDLSAPYSEGVENERDLKDTDEGGCIVTSHETHALQLSANTTPPSGSFAPNDLTIHSIMKRYACMPGPLDELSPFPKSGQREKLLWYARTDHLVLGSSLKMKEIECNIKLKTLDSMNRSGIVDLVEDMRSIAHRHYELDHYRLAETWWRRIITCSLGIPGYQPTKVLFACLWVIVIIRSQGRLSEARSLHRGLHQKILNLVGPEHELAIFSTGALAEIHNAFGEYDSELRICRELLQITLIHFGPRHTITLKILISLAWALGSRNQSRDAETILRIRLGLGCGLSSHADWYTVEESVLAMSELVFCLNRQQKYVDSATLLDVLDVTRRQFRDFIGDEEYCRRYHLEKAYYFRAQGMLAESEDILRTMLKYAPDHANFNIMDGMQELADILISDGRRAEAATWREKVVSMGMKMYPDEYREYWWDVWELGFCYAELGRFGDAIALFKKTAGRVASSQWGDPDSRNEDIEHIHGWICKIEEMKEDAESEGSETSAILEGVDENFAGTFALDKLLII